MVGKVVKRRVWPEIQMSITNALYVAAVIIPSKEDPTRSVCSGIFLHEYWVATAASCFIGRKVRDRQAVVIFGVDDYTAETVNELRSLDVWLHPEYSGPPNANDIALIKLRRSDKVQMDKSKIVYGDHYDYAPGYYWYTYPHLTDENKCIAIGFPNNIYNDTVLNLDIYYINYKWSGCGCKKNNRSFVCGKLSSYSPSCFIYKGGPLICQGMVLGIGSAAYHCGTNDTLCSLETFFSFTYLCSYFRWISKYVPNFPRQCYSMMSSAPAKSPFIIHHLTFIIFIIIAFN
uniref:Peptidase S1 domain-containing protein n=1 Tax=Rhodnius prolixus TaxID=13249 RepID=T1IFJ1_RHOPR